MATKKLTHLLTPIHTLVKPEQLPDLMKELQITPDKLPLIIKDDPAIKHLEAKVGEVIRIERKSHTAGKSIYYRTVSE